MVERTRINQVIEEQNFQQGKLTQAQTIRIGQILNVSKIVIGDVNLIMNQYNVDVRVVDVESGAVIATEGATWAPGSSYRTMMSSLGKRLAEKIAIRPTGTPSSSSQTGSPTGRTKVDTLYGYLKIFPKELGVFSAEPTTVIAQINKQAQYGHNTWRIPTEEELSLLRANNYLSSAKYLSKENPSGVVLLVTEKPSAATLANMTALKARREREQREREAREAAEREAREAAERERQELIAHGATGKLNGHYYVDLGLSVKWATCNVEASSPSEYGGFFVYARERAYAGWSGSWRMPTKAEFQELIDKCTWTWTAQGGHKGYQVTGKSGNSIFLPAAGQHDGLSLDDAGEVGYYWSSTLNHDQSRYTFILYFKSYGSYVDMSHHSYGCTVRLVSE